MIFSLVNISDFEKFIKELLSKEKFYSSLTDRKISDKEYDHVLKVWNKFEMKTMKDYHNLYLKCKCLKNFEINFMDYVKVII